LTQVYKYGGASFATKDSDGHLIFSDFESKMILDLDPLAQQARPIVPEDPKDWFADFNVHPTDSKLVLAVKEDHHSERSRRPRILW
jgi:hypothetical protein